MKIGSNYNIDNVLIDIKNAQLDMVDYIESLSLHVQSLSLEIKEIEAKQKDFNNLVDYSYDEFLKKIKSLEEEINESREKIKCLVQEHRIRI